MKKMALITALLAGYVLNDMVGAFAPMAQADDAGPEFAAALKEVVLQLHLGAKQLFLRF